MPERRERRLEACARCSTQELHAAESDCARKAFEYGRQARRVWPDWAAVQRVVDEYDGWESRMPRWALMDLAGWYTAGWWKEAGE